jgi:hypothetical protein
MSPSMRYDDERATPEYIAKEKKRKRIANLKVFVERWSPRYEAEVKEEKERGEEEHRSC